MTQDVDYLTKAFMGYAANLVKPQFSDEHAISAGRAAGLALELDKPNMAYGMWRKVVPDVVGMPPLDALYAGYKTHRNSFNAFATGEEGKAAFTAPGTRFSNAAGSYARALYYATQAAKPAGHDSLEYWASHWGAQALTAAGFKAEAARLSEAILKGRPLQLYKGKVPSV